MYKLNEIVNTFLLAVNKFMPEMHLRQPQVVYSACGPFTKNKERIQKFKETGDTSYIYKNELDKACFQHDMAYGDFKDLAKRTAAEKVLKDKAFKIANDQKYDGYQRGLASMVYKCFDKKSQGKGVASNNENIQLANELHKPIIKKKGISIVNAFQIILKESNRKPNKIWVDKGSEFYNNYFKKWLKDNDIEMYSTNNEGKSALAERFIRTLKNKSYKYMTSISKNVYIDKLDDIVKKYNNTYHTSIKTKPVDVKDNTYIDFKKEVNDKNPKFKVGDKVRISKYKNIFAKGYMPNWSEEIFIIKKIKNTVPWTYVINDLNGEEIIGTFYENELQKTKQNKFRIEKVIKKKGDKLYVKWKEYNNSFNSLIDEKDIV